MYMYALMSDSASIQALEFHTVRWHWRPPNVSWHSFTAVWCLSAGIKMLPLQFLKLSVDSYKKVCTQSATLAQNSQCNTYLSLSCAAAFRAAAKRAKSRCPIALCRTCGWYSIARVAVHLDPILCCMHMYAVQFQLSSTVSNKPGRTFMFAIINIQMFSWLEVWDLNKATCMTRNENMLSFCNPTDLDDNFEGQSVDKLINNDLAHFHAPVMLHWICRIEFWRIDEVSLHNVNVWHSFSPFSLSLSLSLSLSRAHSKFQSLYFTSVFLFQQLLAACVNSCMQFGVLLLSVFLGLPALFAGSVARN